MSREEAIKLLKEDGCGFCTWQSINPYECKNKECEVKEALEMAIKALSQEPTDENLHREREQAYMQGYEDASNRFRPEPCDDAISREDAIMAIEWGIECTAEEWKKDGRALCAKKIRELPSVTQKSGKCKNCKYFEYDSVAKVDGMPLIVAHEICNKWGNGCKTSEDGFCYLFEPQESEDKE